MTDPTPLPARDDARRLVRVALGREPADLVVRGGILANVYTGELLEGWGVAVAGSRIALVGPEAESCAGPETTVIEARGQTIAPGVLDGHTHLDYMHRLDRYLETAIPTGLTAFVTETATLCNVGGYPALATFLGFLECLPITAFATAPTISYCCSDRGDGRPKITSEEMARLLEEPSVVGLGEIYWPLILADGNDVAILIAKAEAMGKCVEGHTAGARGRKLAAQAAAGVTSCHEPITAEEVRARLRLGLFTMIRDGSIRRDIPALKGVVPGADPRRLMLASDTVWAHHLRERGYMDESARYAVRMGLSPMQALQAITLTPAERFRIEGRLGGLAPGRQADITLLPELAQFRPSLVIARGRIVAREGRTTVPISPPAFPPGSLPNPRTARPLQLEDLRIAAPADRPRVRIRAIHLAAEIVTTAETREVAVRDGVLHADPGADLLKVIAMDRHGAGRIGRGFLSGFGLSRGAVASSVSFDTTNLVAVGENDSDMLMALDRMLALGGGMVVVAGGAVRAEIALPLGGVTSNEPLDVLAADILKIERVLHDLGCRREKPFLAVQILTFTAIPALRIRERGLWDVRQNRVVPLILGDEEG